MIVCNVWQGVAACFFLYVGYNGWALWALGWLAYGLYWLGKNPAVAGPPSDT